MKHRQSVYKLSKLLIYILGRRPDEFGLLPDENGFVKIKDLMKALGEEPGWRHVRLAQIREMIYSTGSPTVEIENNLIRVVDRSFLFFPEIPDCFPKLLYYPIRRRAYPVFLEKGLPATASGNRIILSNDIALAQRLGRRVDPSPVMLIVNSENARKNGATIWQFGKLLFLSNGLPLGSFSGPSLPKKQPGPKQVDLPESQAAPKAPGSYLVDLTMDSTANAPFIRKTHQRKNEWKRDRMRINRNKAKGWSGE